MKLETRVTKARKIKDKNIVPGVMYGSGMQSKSVSTPLIEFVKAYAEYGTSKTFEVKLDGKKHIVYFKEVVHDHLLAGSYKHFDLIKVAKDDTLTTKVRVIWLNKEVPEKRGLILHSVLDEVEIEYPVGKGVSHVEVDVTDVVEHDVLHVEDIISIPDVKILDDPKASIVSVTTFKEVVEVDPEAEEVEVTEE